MKELGKQEHMSRANEEYVAMATEVNRLLACWYMEQMRSHWQNEKHSRNRLRNSSEKQ